MSMSLPLCLSDALAEDAATLAWFLAVAVLIALVVGFFAVLRFGSKRRIVVFYDAKDVAVTFFGPVLLVAAGVFFQSKGPFISALGAFLWHWVFSLALAAAGVGLLTASFSSAIRHARSRPLGVAVWLVKLIFVFAAVLLAIAWYGDMKKGAQPRSTIFAMVGLGALAWLTKSLINGPEVYRAKGWKVPGAADELPPARRRVFGNDYTGSE